MAKSMKPGGGGLFAKGKSALQKKGMPAKAAGAVMAKAGAKKYGAGKMQAFAAAGKKRAAKKGY